MKNIILTTFFFIITNTVFGQDSSLKSSTVSVIENSFTSGTNGDSNKKSQTKSIFNNNTNSDIELLDANKKSEIEVINYSSQKNSGIEPKK